MPPKYKPGDLAYFVENGQIVRQVKILKYNAGFYTVGYVERECIFRTRESRLYATKKEAIAKIPQHIRQWLYRG